MISGQAIISSYPQPLLVQIGALFTLSCDYNSYTFHSWVHPTQGEVTSLHGWFQLTNIREINTGIATLQIYLATIEDQGVYVCRAALTKNNIILNQTISSMVFERVQITTESMLSYEARLCEPVVLNFTALYHDLVTRSRLTAHESDISNSY